MAVVDVAVVQPLSHNRTMTTLTHCLTIGDPTGIGPEIAARFLNHWAHYPQSRLVVLGDITHLHETAVALDLPLPFDARWIEYIPIANDEPGQIAVDALTQAVQLIANGQANGLVTGPISKENLKRAGYAYSGHTEILQALANQFWSTETPWQSDMLFEYHRFRVLLLTRHVALADVTTTLAPDQVAQSLQSVLDYLKFQARLLNPRLCMLGVNPHAGEINGHEEDSILKPVITRIANDYDITIDGPLAADAVFRGFDYRAPSHDCYVATYHDQGLIPMKLVAGYNAVNVTIGLPFMRTSVSHGTAYDIVGQGVANWQSLKHAYELACKLTGNQTPLLNSSLVNTMLTTA